MRREMFYLAGAAALAACGSYSGDFGTGISGQPRVAAISIAPAPLSLGVSDTVRLTATLVDQDGDTLPARPITWLSDNTAVADVGVSSGLVRGVSVGATVVRATIAGDTATGSVPVAVTQ